MDENLTSLNFINSNNGKKQQKPLKRNTPERITDNIIKSDLDGMEKPKIAVRVVDKAMELTDKGWEKIGEERIDILGRLFHDSKQKDLADIVRSTRSQNYSGIINQSDLASVLLLVSLNRKMDKLIELLGEVKK